MLKKKFFVVVLALAVCLVAALALTSCLSSTPTLAATDTEAKPFVKSSELKIAHVTDTHYYPLNYCYNGTAEGTDYEKYVVIGTKLITESSMIVKQALEDAIEENPDYLVVTGDLTHNGEIQAHVELSNLLRKLQNDVRAAGNEDFQIFVTVGNHDMYNQGAVYYRDGGEEKICGHLTNRYDITKIYSSLGYPDLSDAEITAYYASVTDVYFDHLPYEGTFINSTTATGVSVDYQYIDNAVSTPDYDNGDITYVAYCPSDYVFVVVDEEISDEEVFHTVGGKMYQSSKDYLTSKQAANKFRNKTLVGLMHHNAVPHFALEDSLLKDFTVYSWKETTDFLADLGIRTVFTGHMHSNDIATHTSFNGNLITDLETSSVIGYKGAVRYVKLQKGTVDGAYAENLSTFLKLVSDVDVTLVFDEGYLSESYLANCNLTPYVKKASGKIIITDASEYAVTRLFRNIVENVKLQYLDVGFIGGLGDMVAGMLPDNEIVNMIKPYAVDLVNNLISHIEDVVLKDYTYTGSKAQYKSTARGAKLCGYLDELVDRAITLKVDSKGTTLFDFALGDYLKHVGGTDFVADSNNEALAGFKDGTSVKKLLDILLGDNDGLLRLVKGLTLPIDLTKGMSAADQKGVEGIVKLACNVQVDSHKLLLDDLVPGVLELLDVGLDLGGLGLSDFIDHALEDFVTESFYTSLGEIAYTILYQFSNDPTNETETSFTKYVDYRYNLDLTASYVSSEPAEAPSISNGKLPSMLTVTFGEDAKTEKNFVWFTDRRVTGSDIQYMEGEFDATKASSKSGTYDVYATTTGNIDLGIYATLMHVEIGYHCVQLDGLTVGKTYSYRVGSAAKNYWSPVGTFKTAPADDADFEILLITDIQGSANATYEMTAEIMSNIESVFDSGYDFVINCGDFVDNSRNLTQWQYALNTLGSYWKNTTQVIAVGNHDKYAYEKVEDASKEYSLNLPDAVNSNYNYMLLHYKVDYPTQDAASGAYYSFDYSGVHFTVLNTNDLTDDNMMSEAQIEWFKNDLKTTEKKHKVVIMHKGLYSAGSHSTEPDVVNLRKQLTPIISENGVHLVLQGHDHTYSESFYLDKNGKAIQTSAQGGAKIGEEGTLYVTLGTLGDKFYRYVENPNVPVEFGEKLHTPTLQNPTFGKLVYKDGELYYYGYEYDLETKEIKPLRNDMTLQQMIIAIAVAVVGVTGIAVCLSVAVRGRKKKD